MTRTRSSVRTGLRRYSMTPSLRISSSTIGASRMEREGLLEALRPREGVMDLEVLVGQRKSQKALEVDVVFDAENSDHGFIFARRTISNHFSRDEGALPAVACQLLSVNARNRKAADRNGRAFRRNL